MFGRNDNNSASQDPAPVMPQPLESPEPEVSYGASHDAGTAPPLDVVEPSAAAQPPAEPDYIAPPPTDAPYAATPTQPQAPFPVVLPTSAPAEPAAASAPADDLLQIKQSALRSLSPLVGQLDQTPEEKFKTTMMMLQASDNPQLVKDAYAAANKITDEKARAQALLDVVNEINYFTHHDAA